MKKYNIISVKGKEFWWRIYGYRGGRKLEVIFTPEDFPLYSGVVHDLSFWILPRKKIIEKVKSDCLDHLRTNQLRAVKDE